ncbi:MATE efflux family protein 5 [Spatholobus suberectus]|nr:MATE efflux family protein 5 [Spatholobus suberectus]
MDEHFNVVVRHGGKFVRRGQMEYVGIETEWSCIADRWSYFEVVGILKEIGYPCVEGMWYKIGGKQLEVGLKEFKDDKGVLEMDENVLHDEGEGQSVGTNNVEGETVEGQDVEEGNVECETVLHYDGLDV